MSVARQSWVLGVALLCLVAGAQAREAINERRDLAPDGSLTIINVSGEVIVEAWDREEVEITGELGDKSTLEITETSRGLRVEVEAESGNWGFGSRTDTDLRVRAPAGARLSVRGVSADLRISGARGDSLEANTVRGDITVAAEVNRLDLESVSGDIRFEGRAQTTTAEAVSGDIELQGLSGELEASLVSGDLELDGQVFSRGQFESVSGSVELKMAVAPAGRLTVESMSGDVSLVLPADQQGEFSAQTFSGSLRSEFGEPDRARHGPGSRLQHIVGESAATVRLESFSGDIDIRSK